MRCWPPYWRSDRYLAFVGLLVLSGQVSASAQTRADSTRGWRDGEPTSIAGVVTAIYLDDFSNRRSELIHYIRDERTLRTWRLRFRGEAPSELRSGTRATIAGKALGQELYVEAASTEPTGAPASDLINTNSTAASGDQRTLVTLANFRDAAVKCSAEDVRGLMFGQPGTFTVNGLYAAASAGRVTFSGDVPPPVTIDASSTDSCDISAWSSAADAQSMAAGVNPGIYPRRVYVMPPNSCPAAGYGTVGGAQSNAWVFTCDLAGVFAHEVGHGLGMGHASTPVSEYGDGTDPMGFSGWQLRGMNAPHLQQLGWLENSSVPVIRESGNHTIAALAAVGTAASAPRALMLPKPDTNDYYYVSYREANGFDQYIDANYLNRLSIHRYKGDGSSSNTNLVRGLNVGETFVDEANGIRIAMLANGASSATVSIEQTDSCTRGSSSLQLSPAQQGATAGSPRTYVGTLTTGDTGNCGTVGYNLSAKVPNGWTAAFTPSRLDLSPGAAAQFTLLVTSLENAAPAPYTVTVNSTGAIALHAASADATYTVTSPCVSTVPQVSATPVVQSGESGAAVGFDVALANIDSPSCAARTFEMQAGLLSGWLGLFSAPTVTLAPSQQSTISFTLKSPLTATAGRYAVRVNAVDTAQAATGASVSLAYDVVPTGSVPPPSSPVPPPLDVVAPTAPAGITAAVLQRQKQIQVSWLAATDNVGVVGYRVYRNGALVGTVASTSWTDTLSASTVTYYVKAYDAAGNVSASSPSVTNGSSGGGSKKR